MEPTLRALRRVDFDWTLRVQQVWEDNPRDVAHLQKQIREELEDRIEELAERIGNASPLGVPLVGPAGSGKTHLLGAVRSIALERGLFFILCDMTDVADFWDTVVLGYLRSLQQTTVDGSRQVDEWLERLLVKYGENVRKRSDLPRQRPPGLIVTTNELIDAIRQEHRAAVTEHQDVIRALVLFACDHAELNDMGYKWLQGFGIDDDEKEHHGFQAAKRSASQIVSGLSWALGLVAPTVLALDQLDAIVAEHHSASRADLEEPNEQQLRSNRIIQGLAGGLLALRDVAQNTVTIVSALEATWRLLIENSAVSMEDRFEPPLLMKLSSDPGHLRQLIVNRLSASFAKLAITPPYEGYPFRPEFFAKHQTESPRRLLQACYQHVQLCKQYDRVIEVGEKPFVDAEAPPVFDPSRLEKIGREFHDLRKRAEISALLADDSEDIQDETLELLSDALIVENPVPKSVHAQVDKDFMATGTYAPLHARIRLILTSDGERERHHALRFLEKAHFRAFQARLKAAITASGIDHDLSFRGLTIVRSAPIPQGNATSKIVEELTKRGGRILHPSEDDLRTIWAVTALLRKLEEGKVDGLLEHWLRQERPISRLPGFSDVAAQLFSGLGSDEARAESAPESRATKLTKTPTEEALTRAVGSKTKSELATHSSSEVTTATTRQSSPSDVPPSPHSAMSKRMLPVGRVRGASGVGDIVTLPLGGLANHTCVLAGSGSGKSVFLRRIVEEAALLGVPSIVIDGANDLSRLGSPWPERPDTFTDTDVEKASEYQTRVEVTVWTPGNALGNPLELDLLPDFSAFDISTEEGRTELGQAISMATSSLLPLVAPGTGEKARKSEAILRGTLQHFARMKGGTLTRFVDLLREPPDEVIEPFANGDKMARNMSELLFSAIKTDPLLSGEGAKLDPGLLLQGSNGKTRVSVINLSGLAGIDRQRQFIDRLATTLFTYIKKHPARPDSLMGLFILDEAKDFVPSRSNAVGKDNLVRLAGQARKYGLGLLFASQAPKSIDHNVVANCSTLLVGRAQSSAAIDAVQDLIREKGGHADNVAKLDRGEFYLCAAPARPQRIVTSLCLSFHPSSPPSEAEVIEIARASRR